MTTSTETKGPILVTGGAGYIGTHTILCLLKDGYNVVVVDNLVNSTVTSLDRVAELACLDSNSRKERLVFHNVDLCDRDALKQIFENSPTFSSCIHFAGLKAVGESTRIPLKYYHNNLTGTFFLLELMNEYGCRSIVFSSSATVYGSADKMPITEETNVGNGITNAYGRTKYMIEEILIDTAKANKLLGVSLLRYFNPVGAHPSGRIGEAPSGYPNNLMPFIQQVAVGRRDALSVFGSDYNTKDGSGVRDYIHVEDLAEGHVCALGNILSIGSGTTIHNLGSGDGVSVLEMVKAFETSAGKPIPIKMSDRRPGDLAIVVCNPAKANKELNWKTKRSLQDMTDSVWKWVSSHPYGYDDPPAAA